MLKEVIFDNLISRLSDAQLIHLLIRKACWLPKPRPHYVEGILKRICHSEKYRWGLNQRHKESLSLLVQPGNKTIEWKETVQMFRHLSPTKRIFTLASKWLNYHSKTTSSIGQCNAFLSLAVKSVVVLLLFLRHCHTRNSFVHHQHQKCCTLKCLMCNKYVASLYYTNLCDSRS